MGILTADMQRIVREQRLAFVATVCPGTPNLSPKGTITVLDGDHLVFANIRSPQTIANLRHNSTIEINVVDPMVRKGYRFKGTATILDSGATYDQLTATYKTRGVANSIREMVVIKVERALPVTSPAYDGGLSEAEIRTIWERHYEALKNGKSTVE